MASTSSAALGQAQDDNGRAAVFIRYHSGDGFGHVGWGFDVSSGHVDAGSVENHSGHLFTPASRMGFWNGCFSDPVAEMRKHGYDDLKWIDVERADPLLAYRTVLWIEREAYKVLHRNCEDDAYDVLRAYGVQDLAAPTLMWFPKSWFKRFAGTLAHLSEFEWPRHLGCPSAPQEDTWEAHRDGASLHEGVTPWRPTWRRPWHADFHALKARRIMHAFGRR